MQLAGNFLKNTRKPAVIIRTGDVKVSMSADPVSYARIVIDIYIKKLVLSVAI